MKMYINPEKKLLLLIMITFVLIQIPFYFLVKEGTIGLILFAFLLLVTSVTFLAGPITGLYSSLAFIFVIGTALLYVEFFHITHEIALSSISFPLFLMYGLCLIIFVLLAGRIHDLLSGQGKLIRRLREEIRQFVAVDPETGFDNKYRMELELETEMHRIKRYGGTFTLVLIQMDHFQQFKQLYGAKETSHLLASIAQAIRQVMWQTDRKFHYKDDHFALLLTHTDDHAVEVIYTKLADALKTHQLLNKKYVTITFRSGHIVYKSDESIGHADELVAKVESEMIYREL